jgi:hypothetical protein
MRRLEKMEIEKKEAQELKAAEARSTCEECGDYGHVRKDCLEEAKALDYMRKGELPNFRYGQGGPQFNASSSIPNSVPLRIQLKEFTDEPANDEGKLPGQPKGLESAKAIQTRSGKETEDPERSTGARKLKPSTEAEGIAKEKVTGIITEEPEFEMPGEDTRIPQLKPRYFRGKLYNHFEKFVEVVRRHSINMPLLDALRVPTYSRYFKDILANKYEIATLRVDHVNMSKQCSVAIANGLEKQKDPGCPTIPCSVGSFKFEKALCDLVRTMCGSRTGGWSLPCVMSD